MKCAPLFVFLSRFFYVLPPSTVIKCPASQHSQNTINNLNNDFHPLYPFIRSQVQFLRSCSHVGGCASESLTPDAGLEKTETHQTGTNKGNNCARMKAA